MAVSLTKIADGEPAVSNTLLNELTLECPSCEQEFRLGYSDCEWRRLKARQQVAEQADRRNHKSKQKVTSLGIAWRPPRRR